MDLLRAAVVGVILGLNALPSPVSAQVQPGVPQWELVMDEFAFVPDIAGDIPVGSAFSVTVPVRRSCGGQMALLEDQGLVAGIQGPPGYAFEYEPGLAFSRRSCIEAAEELAFTVNVTLHRGAASSSFVILWEPQPTALGLHAAGEAFSLTVGIGVEEETPSPAPSASAAPLASPAPPTRPAPGGKQSPGPGMAAAVALAGCAVLARRRRN